MKKKLEPDRIFRIKFVIGCFAFAAGCGVAYLYGSVFVSAAASSLGALAIFLGAMALIAPVDV